MAYELINWEDFPSLNTPINAQNLKKMDEGIKNACDHAQSKGKEFASGLYKITTNTEGHVTEAAKATKEDIVALGIMGEVPQSNWEQMDSASTDYIVNKPPISNGLGMESIVIGTGDAKGNYSFAGGSTDTSVVKEMLGTITATLIGTPDKSFAGGEMSMAYGAGAKAHSTGTMSLGLNTQAGCLGYYWTDIDFSGTNPVITLSTAQNSQSIPSDIPWSARITVLGKVISNGDMVSIVNNKRYINCSEILSIDKTNGKITVESLPFTEIDKPTVAYPDDYGIYVCEKPDKGEVEFGWGALALGYNCKSLGSFGGAIGYENITASNFGFVVGRENLGGYGSLVSGYNNNAPAETTLSSGKGNIVQGNNGSSVGYSNQEYGHCGNVFGHSNILGKETSPNGTDYGYAGLVGGHSNTVQGNFGLVGGHSNIVDEDYGLVGGYSNTATGKYNTVGGRNNQALAQSDSAFGSENAVAGNHGFVSGYQNKIYSHVAYGEGHTNVIGSEDDPDSRIQGVGSHVEGRENKITGNYTHVQGYGNIGAGNYQDVIGKYNIEDTEDKFVHIIGGGASDSERKNIHTVDWNGNAWYAGVVETTAIILKSSTEGSEKCFRITVDDTGILSATEII